MVQGDEFVDTEVHHRHMSHLFGLYPGHTLTLQETPELCEAATKSMIKRGTRFDIPMNGEIGNFHSQVSRPDNSKFPNFH